MDNISEKRLDSLSNFLDWKENYTKTETDKVYKIDTWFIKLRNVPRDVVDSSVRKKSTDHVVQQHFNIKFIIDNTGVIGLKRNSSPLGITNFIHIEQ